MTVTKRDGFGWILASVAGPTIAVIDASPNWDDTGITAGALFAAAAVAAFVAGRRPWVIALLVGLPTPLLEVPRTGQPAAFAAIAFAAVGALCGFLVARSLQREARAD